MATIKNTLTLQDRVTPVLNRVIDRLIMTVDNLQRVNTSGSMAFDGMRTDLVAARADLTRLSNQLQQTTKNIDRASKSTSGWALNFAGLYSAIGIVRTIGTAVSDAASLADSYNSINARLKYMTGSLEAANQIQKEILDSANRSRGVYKDTAQMVASLGIMAKDAFSVDGVLDTRQLVGFAEAVNKQFAIGGVTNENSKSAAILQLTQAMSSGRLQGDELRSIMEQAPLIADTVAKYMEELGRWGDNISVGTLRKLAADGEVTAEIVKNAMLGSLEDIQDAYDQLPVTSGQAFNLIKNDAYEAFKPVLQRFSDFINSDEFQATLNYISQAIQKTVSFAMKFMDIISRIAKSEGFKNFVADINAIISALRWVALVTAQVVGFIIQHWNLISPFVWSVVGAIVAYNVVTKSAAVMTAIFTGISKLTTGVLAFLAYAFTKAGTTSTMASVGTFMFGNALTVVQAKILGIIAIVLLVIAVFVTVINVINELTGSSISALGIITGAFAVAGAAIWNILMGILQIGIDVVNGFYSVFSAVASFLGNIFVDPVSSIIYLFRDMVTGVLKAVRGVTNFIDTILGTSLSDSVNGWINSVNDVADNIAKKYGNGKYQYAETGEITLESLGLSRIDYGEAWDAGYNFGDQVQTSIGDALGGLMDFDSDYYTEKLAGDFSDWVENPNVDASGSEVTITDEDIKLLKDVAQAEWVNKYTTLRPELTVTFGDVHETADTNKIMEAMETMIANAYASALTEG